jgi:hypothetical protein
MVALTSTPAAAAVLLQVDLSVADTITITATSGTSDATVSGPQAIGVYLDDFFGASGTALTSTLVSGDLTTSGNPSDLSPALYRSGSAMQDVTDPGLNIYSFSTDTEVEFTAGSLAFSGAATWTIPAAIYNEALAGPTSGTLYFPAESLGQSGRATAIGTWERLDAAQIEPPMPVPTLSGWMLSLLSGFLVMLGWRGYRRQAGA